MRTRHAAALALVGWYFIFPPLPGGIPDVQAPLSKWIRVRNLDTAPDCEQVRLGTLLEAQKELHKVEAKIAALPDSGTRPLREVAPDVYKADDEASRFAATALAAQCIATDDPRLAK